MAFRNPGNALLPASRNATEGVPYSQIAKSHSLDGRGFIAIGKRLFLFRFRLGGLFFAALETGVAGGGEFLLELFNPPGRIDVFQLAGVKGVTDVADIDL